VNLIGLDLGSARCGVCLLCDGTPTAACTVDIESTNATGAAFVDYARATAEILSAVRDSGAVRLIAEWAPLYIPPSATPQQASAMGRSHEVMAILLDRVEQGCAALGVPVVRMHASTWRARIGARRKRMTGLAGFRRGAWAKLNPRRDTTDRAVRVALENHWPTLARTLANVHERDAAGVALGEWLGAKAPEPKAPAPRAPRAPGEPPARDRSKRKLGTKRMRAGHPSDAAFEALLAARNAKP